MYTFFQIEVEFLLPIVVMEDSTKLLSILKTSFLEFSSNFPYHNEKL